MKSHRYSFALIFLDRATGMTKRLLQRGYFKYASTIFIKRISSSDSWRYERKAMQMLAPQAIAIRVGTKDIKRNTQLDFFIKTHQIDAPLVII